MTNDTETGWLTVDNANNQISGTRPVNTANDGNITVSFSVSATNSINQSVDSNSGQLNLMHDEDPVTAVIDGVDCYEGVYCEFNMLDYITDPESDTITIDMTEFTSSDTLSQIVRNDTIPGFSGYVTQAEVGFAGEGQQIYRFSLRVKDQHKDINGETGFKNLIPWIYVYYNRVPIYTDGCKYNSLLVVLEHS